MKKTIDKANNLLKTITIFLVVGLVIYFLIKFSPQLKVFFNFIWTDVPLRLSFMQNSHFWLIIIILAIFSASFFVISFVLLKRFRIIADTPTAKIKSAAQGYVEFEGFGNNFPNNTLTAPLSQEKCVWYNYKIEQAQTRLMGKTDKREWRIIENKISEDAFLLQDETGKCSVYPKGAKIIGADKLIWYGHTKYPKKYQRSIFGMMGNYRYTEFIIRPYTPLYTLGMFKTISTETKKINTLSHKDLHGRPFLISTISQHKLITHTRIYSALSFSMFLLILTYILRILYLQGSI